MIYITGDTHREFSRIFNLCEKMKTTKADILIILGDVGINYYGEEDKEIKKVLSELPITFFCIHGNHENRPENIESYKKKLFKQGLVYYEEEYPNLLFAIDSEIYDFDGKRCLVIGGAYSIDKEIRILRNLGWWEDEQPSYKTKQKVLKMIDKKLKVDIVLTHTCPTRYLPYEVFLPEFDQTKVDRSTEDFLNFVEQKIEYKKWFCGHYHTEKIIDKIEFMFKSIKQF